jgi:hypothetical protein
MGVLSKAKRFGRDLAAHVIAPLLRRLAPDPKYFELWQSHGFHVLPSDNYQPIPDTRVLPLSLWNRISDLPGMDMREEAQSNCSQRSLQDLRTSTQPSRKELRHQSFIFIWETSLSRRWTQKCSLG